MTKGEAWLGLGMLAALVAWSSALVAWGWNHWMVPLGGSSMGLWGAFCASFVVRALVGVPAAQAEKSLWRAVVGDATVLAVATLIMAAWIL